jgi:hypothetical protein
MELSNMTAGGDLNAVGFDVEARDGSVGKVDQATQEIGSGHVVVDQIKDSPEYTPSPPTPGA